MSHSRTFTILSVEDDPSDRELLSYAFKSLGARATLRFAVDGLEAVEYLSGAGRYSDRTLYPEPDVVLLDLKLPRRSGFEVLEWMRAQQRYKPTPVFIMTSSAELKDIDRCYALGATSYLVKTPDLDELERAVCGLADYSEVLVRRNIDRPTTGEWGA